MKVGIPRALLYYWYGPAWKAFLRAAGLEPVVSPPTNKAIMTAGLKAAVDEICLPVKVFIGHCLELQKSCDAVLVPRLTRVARKEFTCPKFMGLPDMVRRLLPGTPVIVWESTGSFLPERVWALEESGEGSARIFARELPALAGRMRKPLAAAGKAHAVYTGLLRRGYLPEEAMAVSGGLKDRPAAIWQRSSRPESGQDLPGVDDPVGRHGQGVLKPGRVIGLVGHPYCIYDSFVNTGILRFLQQEGCRLLTMEMLAEEEITAALAGLPKAVYWTMGRLTLGAARIFRQAGVDGLIHVAAFACGPEALIGELIKRECSGEIPYLQIYLDEHSGEAGLHTRLEAFLDLARGKEQAGCV